MPERYISHPTGPNNHGPEVVLVLKGRECGVEINVNSVLYNCKLVRDILDSTVDDMRTGDIDPVISGKELRNLNKSFKYGLLQIFRADCLAGIISHTPAMMRVTVLYEIMMRARQELTLIHIMLGIKLPRILAVVSDEEVRHNLFRMHIKDTKRVSDEISWYETNRVRRLVAEWN